MKAFSKRVLSLTMATAMVLSLAAVPTTDANAASKYSLTKRTAAYTGKTYNYYLKGVSKSQYAKVSVSGTAKNLVSVKLGSKTIKSTTKIKGTGKTLTLKVKASKASSKKYALTAKIYNKKTKKLVKTLKTPTVTVYNNYIKSISGETTVAAGATTTLKAVKKYSQSTATVNWASSNTDVATVSASGVVTGVGAGTSVITATCGSYSKSVVVTVTAAETTTGVTGSVINAMADYKDTVFVNQNANLVITVKDGEGKVVPNVPVTLEITKDMSVPDKARILNTSSFMGTTGVVTTDSLGQATFVIGPRTKSASEYKIDDTTQVQSIQYKASVAGNVNASKEFVGNVSFAALSLGGLGVVETDGNGNTVTKLDQGVNAASSNTASIQKSVPVSNDTKGDQPNQYVATQMVSAAGTTEHQVTFTTSAKLMRPATAAVDNEKVLEFTQAVGIKSDKYGVYDVKTANIVLNVDPSKLRYANLNFNSLQLSKYSKMTITSYTDSEFKNSIGASIVTIKGEKQQSNYAYQIPVTSGAKAIRVTIESAGQINKDMANGYDIKDITGIYNESASSGAVYDPVDIPSAKFTWEAVNPTYSNEFDIAKGNQTTWFCDALGITPIDTTTTFNYSVPVFPYTGNAIIKEFDKNGNVKTYYVAPTENVRAKDTDGKVQYMNANEISALLSYTAHDVKTVTGKNGKDADAKNCKNPAAKNKAYKVTTTEATTVLTSGVKAANENGTVVTVNSEKVGKTELKGTLSIAGATGESLLNAANKTLYASVHWNPIPASNGTTESGADHGYIALAGQNVTVIAQLIDKNGNPVTIAGKDVKFELPEYAKAAGSGLTQVSNTGKTDTNGQAKLVLNAAQDFELVSVSAKSEDDAYSVELHVGKDTEAAKKADIYWVTANLGFTKDVDASQDDTLTNKTEIVDVSDPVVGQNMQYGVYTIADSLTDGIFRGRRVVIDNLTINMSSGAGAKGTYNFSTAKTSKGEKTAIVDATSNVAQKDYIISNINKNSVGTDVTFTTTKTNAETIVVKNVGEGLANIDATLKLGVNWQKSGVAIDLITAAGTNAVAGVSTNVIVKVVDTKGNPLADEDVKLSVGDNKLSVDNGTNWVTEATTKTDAKGIAYVAIKDENGTAGKSTVLTVKHESTELLATATINWVAARPDFTLVSATTSADKKQIIATFNNEVCAASVQAGEFNVEYTDQDKTFKINVTNATAVENTVVLDLASALSTSDYKLKVGKTTVDGIVYGLTDYTGSKLVSDSVKFYSDKAAKFIISKSDKANSKVVVTNIEQPYVGKNPDDVTAYLVVTKANGDNVVKIKTIKDNETEFEFTGVTLAASDSVRVYINGGVAEDTVQ